MSEEGRTSPSMSEYNKSVPTESPQVHIIDIIDGIGNPTGMVLHENARLGSEDTFVQENHEENRKTPHDIVKCGNLIQLRDEDRKTEEKEVENSNVIEEERNDRASQEARENEVASGKGTLNRKTPVNNSENEIACEDQLTSEKPEEETDNSFKKIEEVELFESRKKTRSEAQSGEILEELEMETVDQNIQLIKKMENNGEELCLSTQENSSSPCSPSMKMVPGSGSKPDISSYSKYNTVSYRKIRKGNTKQRVDEFESMMNL
ncbi:ermin [Rhinatrema bivittatum]|uniref:ermin n=1 Tax=Rhinatrema bivittatum TaxID=194408 RepID=UPI001125E681|nr:ermin [Rhinatrema bivittatum]